MKRNNRIEKIKTGNVLLFVSLWVGFVLITAFGGSKISLSVCFVLPFSVGISLLMQYLASKKQSMELSMPIAAVQKGEVIEGTLLYRNPTLMPVHRFYCELECRNTYTDETEIIVLDGAVPLKENSEISFSVQSKHCGYAEIRIRKVRLYDLFGLVFIPVKIQAQTAGTPVFPNMYPVKILPRSMVLRSFSASDRMTQMKGQDLSETFQLREYVPGDSLRQVHWKLSEKTEKLIVRDGVSFGRQAVLVYLDTMESAEKAEYADALADAAASFCGALEDNGISLDIAFRTADGIRREAVSRTQSFHAHILQAIRHCGRDLQGLVNDIDDGDSQVLYFTTKLPSDFSLLESTNRYTFILCGECSDKKVISFLPDRPPVEMEL